MNQDSLGLTKKFQEPISISGPTNENHHYRAEEPITNNKEATMNQSLFCEIC